MYDILEEFLSKERLNAYLQRNKTKDEALMHYEINIIISHSFYVFLQFIEIGLRNKINKALINCFGNEWYLNKKLLFGENQEKGISTIEKINGIIKKITETKIEKKKEIVITNGDIVSWLDFGFWTNIFCGNYANNIWSQCLKYEFKDFKRKDLHNKLNKIRNIRNRVFHYEPIINDLNDDIGKNSKLIFDMLEYIYGKELSNYIFDISDISRFLNRSLELSLKIKKDPDAPLNQ